MEQTWQGKPQRGTVSQAEDELEYVGFWLRVWAALVDSVLLLLVLVPLGLALFGSERVAQSFSTFGGDWQGVAGAGLVLEGVPGFFLNYVVPAAIVLWFWSSKQATPGKMLIGARIVDARTGAHPSMRQNIVRYLGYFLSTIFFGLGLLWVGFDRRKQGWHDKLAGTVVVRRRQRATEPVRFDA